MQESIGDEGDRCYLNGCVKIFPPGSALILTPILNQECEQISFSATGKRETQATSDTHDVDSVRMHVFCYWIKETGIDYLEFDINLLAMQKLELRMAPEKNTLWQMCFYTHCRVESFVTDPLKHASDANHQPAASEKLCQARGVAAEWSTPRDLSKCVPLPSNRRSRSDPELNLYN